MPYSTTIAQRATTATIARVLRVSFCLTPVFFRFPHLVDPTLLLNGAWRTRSDPNPTLPLPLVLVLGLVIVVAVVVGLYNNILLLLLLLLLYYTLQCTSCQVDWPWVPHLGPTLYQHHP